MVYTIAISMFSSFLIVCTITLRAVNRTLALWFPGHRALIKCLYVIISKAHTYFMKFCDTVNSSNVGLVTFELQVVPRNILFIITKRAET